MTPLGGATSGAMLSVGAIQHSSRSLGGAALTARVSCRGSPQSHIPDRGVGDPGGADFGRLGTRRRADSDIKLFLPTFSAGVALAGQVSFV